MVQGAEHELGESANNTEADLETKSEELQRDVKRDTSGGRING